MSYPDKPDPVWDEDIKEKERAMSETMWLFTVAGGAIVAAIASIVFVWHGTRRGRCQHGIREGEWCGYCELVMQQRLEDEPGELVNPKSEEL